MASSHPAAFLVHCSVQKPSISHNFQHFKTKLSSAFKPFFKGIELSPTVQIGVSPFIIREMSIKLLDAFVDSVFEFVDQPLLPSQANFAPVDELKEAVVLTAIDGRIPDDFQEGVYIRNGPNPLFGGLKSTESIFGKSSHTWVEGEGMLHALYFSKNHDGIWTIVYNNKHVETETMKQEKQLNKPSFLPAIEGDSPSILTAYLLNLLRFGKINKFLSNTNIIEHSGKFYSVSENHIPQEIDVFTLETLGNWDVNGGWTRPFTAHPKRVPGSRELVIMGVDATKPFVEVGVVSADGMELVHKVDLKLNRCTLSHDIGVTQRYNVFMDCPISIDIQRLLRGGPLIKYNKKGYARIGIIPRYGDSDSIQWFDVEPNCTFHLINCFEENDEVIVWGCRALESIIPGPDCGKNKFEWFSSKFKHDDAMEDDQVIFPRPYEWRLNMKTGEVEERNLTGKKFSMDFPFINEAFSGIKNKYGYAQVVDSLASSASGVAKYGGIAKLYFEETSTESSSIKVEYHMFEENAYCTGASFVPKQGGDDEDDGWIITFVHNENTNTTQVHIIDTKNFSSNPVAKINLPCRVPYGFHGAFMPMGLQISSQP